jgi:hypothetical protein
MRYDYWRLSAVDPRGGSRDATFLVRTWSAA